MNNDFENKKDINDSKENTDEVKNDNQAWQNIKESEKKSEGLDKDQEKAAEEKGQADEEKADTAEKERKDAEENSERDNVSGEYVPDFTVVGESVGVAERAEKKKAGRMSNGAILALCAVTLVLSLIIGAFAGAIAGGVIKLDFGNAEQVQIIRSNRKFEVETTLLDPEYQYTSVEQVADVVSKSVVEITTAQVQTGIGGQYIQSGAGSGVIFDYDGTTGKIVTNYHVIEGANKISVSVKRDADNHETYEAEYIAGDAGEDIAVLEIKPKSDHALVPAIFADSDALNVGQQVVAIGNPLGQLGGTVTDGIISALDRQIAVGDYTMQLLQTNAAINPGNSGGGLFDMSGRLVGIVNAKQSSSGIEGLGFAIPSNIVLKDIEDILEVGYIRGRKTLGATVQYAHDNYRYGVFVTEAGSTELQYGDCIVEISDKEKNEIDKIESMSDYNKALDKHAIDASVTVRVIRKQKYVDVTLKVLENTSKY